MSISSFSCSSSPPPPAVSWCLLLHSSGCESSVWGSSLPHKTSRLYLKRRETLMFSQNQQELTDCLWAPWQHKKLSFEMFGWSCQMDCRFSFPVRGNNQSHVLNSLFSTLMTAGTTDGPEVTDHVTTIKTKNMLTDFRRRTPPPCQTVKKQDVFRGTLVFIRQVLSRSTVQLTLQDKQCEQSTNGRHQLFSFYLPPSWVPDKKIDPILSTMRAVTINRFLLLMFTGVHASCTLLQVRIWV